VTGAIGLTALRMQGMAGRPAILAAWACAGLATLAKGPLGLALPVLVIGAYVVVTRDWARTREALSPAGVLAFVLVAGPWHALIVRDQGAAFFDVFLLDHNVRRFTSTIHRHPGPVWFYLPLLVAGLFPWSSLGLPALATLTPRASRRDLLVLLWVCGPLIVFSAAGSKLPGYILPCLPPLALLIGRAAAGLVTGELKAPRGAGTRAASLTALVLAGLIGAMPLVLQRRGEPLWGQTIPLAVWAVIMALGFSSRIAADPAGALHVLRIGAAGTVLLLANTAPSIVAARDSGRSLFLPARGREVLAWRAWRTAWMAGYFYNDGHVREVQTLAEITRALERGPVLVLCGPRERQALEHLPALRTRALAEGPRAHALLEVELRRD
jgi:4-amino-4-deoxy-L-arabinose transferase-like glycosyltransferase